MPGRGVIYDRKGRILADNITAFRLDVTPVDWGRTGKWRFYYTIINITDAANLFAVNYDTETNPPKKSETYQFPILPFFMGFEYQF